MNVPILAYIYIVLGFGSKIRYTICILGGENNLNAQPPLTSLSL